jgi:hypothetical protein
MPGQTEVAMEQKFVKFEEALAKLNISAERLNQLREDGELRAYRDGSSWKFRADEIDRMADEGVPEPAPPSDIGLVDDKDLVEASDLELADLDELRLADENDVSLGGSELELAADQEDTVTAGASDAALNIHEPLDEPSDPSDSILLSEEALGESAPNAPSTIIGKSELEDADLELALDDEDDPSKSDVQLAAGASNVLSSHIAGSGVLDELEKESGGTSAFEDLEELEIDLAAESSRILSPKEAAEIKAKGDLLAKKPPTEGDSDLTLDDGSLAGEDEGTDPVPEALESGKAKAQSKDTGPTSDLELATDEDDFVLAEAGGSDITLDSGDSGINLVSPSDSGLALDDIPLEIGGSAILESLSKGDKGGSDFSLVGSDVAQGEPLAKLQTDDDFRLTPLGDKEDEGDSSSQVIALDAGLDDLGAGDAGILGEDAFAEEPGGVALADDYGEAPAADFGAGYAPAARIEGEYTVWNIVALCCATLLLLLITVLMLDLVRNIWSWDSNLALNDSLLDSILGMFGLKTR